MRLGASPVQRKVGFAVKAYASACKSVVLAGAAVAMLGCKPSSRPEPAERAPAEQINVAVGAASTTCITVQRGTGGTVADTQIAAGDAQRQAKNYGTSWTANSGQVDGGARQMLMRFDLAGVPTGWTVTSATLTVVQTNDQAAMVRAHRITAAWQDATVTWNSFAAAYDPAVAATFPNGGPAYAGPLTADLSALAQGWVNDPATNHGVLLEQDLGGATRYWTSDDPNVAEQPKLHVCYTAPTCSDGLQNQGERGVDCGGPCGKECPHPPASEAVSAGDSAASSNYKVVYTFGQPTQNQDKSTSTNYRVQGGLVGANGSLP